MQKQENAAHGGHLDVLKWAREHHCPWNGVTCACAFNRGHMDVLMWAREHDCPWNDVMCALATAGGHLGGARLPGAHGHATQCCQERAFARAEVGARARLAVGSACVCARCCWETSEGAEVGAGARLQVGREDVCEYRSGRMLR
jgi:hypothetical protein